MHVVLQSNSNNYSASMEMHILIYYPEVFHLVSGGLIMSSL